MAYLLNKENSVTKYSSSKRDQSFMLLLATTRRVLDFFYFQRNLYI